MKSLQPRVQKQLSLPSEYWEAIESLVGTGLIRSRGDAVVTIMDKVYDHLPNIGTVQKNKEKPKDFCFCGHPRMIHEHGKCGVQGCQCRRFEFDEKGTPGKQKELERLTQESEKT